MYSPGSWSSAWPSISDLTQMSHSSSAFATRPALVHPVRGDAVLGLLVHVARPHLDLERLPLGTDHGRVQRAVAVELRHRDEVLEPPGHRLPERVDEAERGVAVARSLLARALADDAQRRQVVDLVELAAALGHLVVDRVEVLRAAGDVSRHVRLLELFAEDLGSLVGLLLAVGAAVRDHRLDLGVLAWVQASGTRGPRAPT